MDGENDDTGNWPELAMRFLVKYLPPSTILKRKYEIISFSQIDGETLKESWDRFKKLLRRFLVHNLPKG